MKVPDISGYILGHYPQVLAHPVNALHIDINCYDKVKACKHLLTAFVCFLRTLERFNVLYLSTNKSTCGGGVGNTYFSCIISVFDLQ